MNRLEILPTEDGSLTLRRGSCGESFHSHRGAIGESLHVFIDGALEVRASQWDSLETITIFEVGFGSALNCYLSLKKAQELGLKISYHAIELYPIDNEIANSYGEMLSFSDDFNRLHSAPWGETTVINDYFTVTKIKGDFTQHQHSAKYDVVYFDAFSPDSEPQMWSKELFENLYSSMRAGGIISTYCAKGAVRRDMEAAGFSVERMDGALGKRHMLRGIKL